MIPIFRAKKIDSDEYNCGYLIKADDYDTDEDEDQIVYFIMHKMENYRTNEVWDFICNSRIDTTTLSIHFPDMIDSQGNKIFASLQEDGKGGDKFLFDNEIFIIWFDNQSLKINATNKDNFECNCHDSLQEWYDFENKCYDLKIIGIQQWNQYLYYY